MSKERGGEEMFEWGGCDVEVLRGDWGDVKGANRRILMWKEPWDRSCRAAGLGTQTGLFDVVYDERKSI